MTTPVIPPLSEHERELVESARRFAEAVLAPEAEAWEERAEFPAAAFAEACRLGFGSLLVPREAGGAGVSLVGALAVLEELAYADLAVTFALFCHNSCCTIVWKDGTPEQQEQWLPRLVSGEVIGCPSMTEPQAGSDAASITTHAVAADGGWTLDGHKSFASNAPVAGLFVVNAKTDPELGGKGISRFLIPREAPGVEVGPAQSLIGTRALQLGELELRSCRLPAGALIGERGTGLKLSFHGLNTARAIWGACAVGVARAALDQAIAYLREREQFGGPLIEQQGIRFQLADLATELEASRVLAYRAAAQIDAGGERNEVMRIASMAKRHAGDMAVRVTSGALELLGGVGYLAPNPLERYLRGARMAQLADGTGNIQRIVIARTLV